MGWSQHFLGGNGIVLNITPVYADNEDRLYFHVRRSDETGVGAKEYLEVLNTRYFSAKNFELQKPVYADCYVNAARPLENIIHNTALQTIRDDSAIEFRGSITKLEQIIQAEAENILKLNLANIDIQGSFKYQGKFIVPTTTIA
jgi:hypothetical protein